MLTVRVRVLEAWDDVVLHLPAGTTIGDVKRQALAAVHNPAAPDEYELKFRGAAMRDESRSLAEERVPTDAALIVLRARRVPVR
jgi:hypothetical protein